MPLKSNALVDTIRSRCNPNTHIPHFIHNPWLAFFSYSDRLSIMKVMIQFKPGVTIHILDDRKLYVSGSQLYSQYKFLKFGFITTFKCVPLFEQKVCVIG